MADTLTVQPVRFYSYEFRIKFDGFKLSGNMHSKLIEKAVVVKELFTASEPCMFFKAPKDYSGFKYHKITETEKYQIQLYVSWLIEKRVNLRKMCQL